ncbi:F-box/kelch-repeat protein At1g57790 [Linum grandiflorum]
MKPQIGEGATSGDVVTSSLALCSALIGEQIRGLKKGADDDDGRFLVALARMGLQERRPWSDLFPEILCSILSNLHGKDIPVFRAVCRNWSSIPEPLTKHVTDPFSEIVKHPFLLRSTCSELYSPAYNKTYCQPGLPNARILSSNFGWLLISIGGTFFFHNPSTGDSIKLPHDPYPVALWYNVMSFSAPPTSPDCVVFCLLNHPEHDSLEHLAFIRRGDRSWHHSPNWSTMKLEIERESMVARNHKSSSRKRVMVNQGNRGKFRLFPCKAEFNWSDHRSAPVFHKGAFYCLSQGGGGRGRLGIFDPTKKTKKNMWRILDVESCRTYFSTNYHDQSFLMESSRGELISVFVERYGEFVRVFKFDEELELWQSVCSLGDQVAFLSPTSSIILPCRELQVKGLENTIHFARFDEDGNHNVFYSLSTGKFHSFKNGCTSDDLFDTQLYLNSTWIVPDFRSFSRQRLNWNDLSSEDNATIVVNNSSHYACNSTLLRNSSYENRKTEQVAAPVGTPLIILSHGEHKLEAWRFVDLVNGRGSMELSFRGKEVYGVTNRRVVVFDFESRDCYLLNTSTMAMEPLPTWPMSEKKFKLCYVVHELDSNAVTIFGVLDEKNFIHLNCRVGDEEWTRKNHGEDEPRAYEALAYQGMIYGAAMISEDGEYDGEGKLLKMEVSQEVDEEGWRGVEVVEMVEFPPYRPIGTVKRVWEYLVESCGEILVFMVFWSECNSLEQVIIEVRAYRLDSKDNMRLEEVNDLGDRAFFICNKNRGFGCCASGSGFSRNNIYFVSRTGDRIIRYNYGDHSIKTVVTCKEGCGIVGLVMQ